MKRTVAKSNSNATPLRSSYHHGDLRAALLRSAGEELESKGLESFSMRGVAKHAGVSHAAPAHHFADTNGLLTALAAKGYREFVEIQLKRQNKARPDARSQLIAAGLAYIEFASGKPALYRLMFSSERPDKNNPDLHEAASAAFQKLMNQVQELTGNDPEKDQNAMLDVLSIWSMVHGLADLLNAERLEPLACLTKAQREKALTRIIVGALPNSNV